MYFGAFLFKVYKYLFLSLYDFMCVCQNVKVYLEIITLQTALKFFLTNFSQVIFFYSYDWSKIHERFCTQWINPSKLKTVVVEWLIDSSDICLFLF